MIPCLEQCIYQRDGTCKLRRAVSVGEVATGCAYCVKTKKTAEGKSSAASF